MFGGRPTACEGSPINSGLCPSEGLMEHYVVEGGENVLQDTASHNGDGRNFLAVAQRSVPLILELA